MSTQESNAWLFSDEPDYRMITVIGEDAGKFLQGQLTQDVLGLPENQAKWFASCNYAGRVASTGLIFHIPDGYGLLVRATLAQKEVDRLQEFVLRSKVIVAMEEGPITFIEGEEDAVAKAKCPALPLNPFEVWQGHGTVCVRLAPADNDKLRARFVAVGPIPPNMELGPKTSNQMEKYLIDQGVALIDQKETLAWLPQALNLDLIGAISFKKGCYTGQEVVSKTQHLGKVKRRMFLGTTDAEDIDPGTEVFMEDEPMGHVLQSVDKKFLYVMRFDYFDSELYVKGSLIKKLDLPYSVTVPTSVI
ncbi:MAG: folate-binding protein [Burkholderiales bacterium]|nr:folate-binding protein [Burkholderiales bacterium]